jgi:N6-adenosine-specific RNA methylase IME4
LGNKKFEGHVIAARREHSRKPDCVRDEIVALLDGPRIELFARSLHPGFDAWGDQVTLFGGQQAYGASYER